MMASAFDDLLEFRKHQTKPPTQKEKEEQFTTLELGKRGMAAVLSVDTLGSTGDPTMARMAARRVWMAYPIPRLVL